MKNQNVVLTLTFFVLFSSLSTIALAKKKKKGGFYQGQNTAHVGIGFPSMINASKNDLNVYGEAKRSGMPPISLRFESALTKSISFGGFLGYSKEKITVTDRTNPKNINGFDYSFTVVGGRLGFHIPLKSKKLDPYAAALLGYTLTKGKPFGENNYFDEPKSMLAYGIHAGVNYYLQPKIALFAEVGYGFALVNAGLTVRF